MASEKKSVYDELYNFQTRLQGVANDLGIKLAAVVSSTDKDVLDVLTKELPKGQKKSIEGEIRRLKEITDAVEKVREKGFDAAKDTLFSTSLDVAKAGTSETAKEFNRALGEAARKEREQRFCKTLNDKQLKAIVDGQGIDGATIGDWFSGWKRDDLERISRAVQTATVEQMTVSDVAKLVRGTKENNYSDGVLGATRVGAVRLARTVVNGVCNNARVETIKENSDVIDGIKFVGTLDGKTCPHCASYDGHIWRGEDMASARRPPIHPNCRCTLVPYVELKDDEGNVVDIDNERPAANADFDQLAKDAYNEKAREKGWKRRFEDLSPSTRLKYYYQAQKDYEKETGKPAYRQVDSKLSFPEYFKQQPDSFKRDWLGAKRYEAYKKGKLTEKAIFAPDLAYTVSPASLVRFVEPEVPEELAKLVDKYEKNGSPALPNPTSGNAIDYTKFVPDYDGETNVDTLRKRWEKLDLQELEKLSDDIWERSKAWRSYIWDFQPKKGDFSSKEDYDKAHEDYLHAYHHVFWSQLSNVVRELIEEAKKKTTVPEIDYSQYKPTFRDSSDVDTILQSLQSLSVEELGKIRKEAFDEYLKWGLYFNQFQPDPKDYATKEEHDKAWERWHDFKKNNDREFWHRILHGIDALKEKASSSAEELSKERDEEIKLLIGTPKDWEGKQIADIFIDDIFKYADSQNNSLFDTLKSVYEKSKKEDFSTLPQNQRAAVDKRMEELRQLVERGADAVHFGRTPDSTDEMLRFSYQLSKEGLREALPPKINIEAHNLNSWDSLSGWFSDGNTTRNINGQNYGSFGEYVANKMGAEGFNFITEANADQASGSYEPVSVMRKLCILKTQGFDCTDPKYKTFDDFAKDIERVGYYCGDKNGTHTQKEQRQQFEDQFHEYRNNRNRFDSCYRAVNQYDAAVQLILENVQMANVDPKTRTYILVRTEQDGIMQSSPGKTGAPAFGERTYHRVGVCESHSRVQTAYADGDNTTVVRVPFSRVHGLWIVERGYFVRGKYIPDGCVQYADPDENETTADTHGLNIINVSKNADVAEAHRANAMWERKHADQVVTGVQI